MISPEAIRQQADRKYPDFLRSLVLGEPFFPCEIRGLNSKARMDFVRLDAAMKALLSLAKPQAAHGYVIDFKTRKTQTSNVQQLPERVFFETEADFVHFLHKGTEVAAFKRDSRLIVNTLPALRTWVRAYPEKVVEYAGAWEGLTEVCLYFVRNPRPGLYLRQLPVSVHTKFIETHTGILRQLLEALLPETAVDQAYTRFERRFGLREKEELLRLRFLDPELAPGPALMDISVPVTAFHQLGLRPRQCFITENEMNFLALPPFPGGVAIWGKGFIISHLAGCPWLKDVPIRYWGDLDTHGLQIFDQVKGYFPQALPMLMDRTTLDAWYTGGQGKPTNVQGLKHADAATSTLFLHLKETGKRLEQEQIPQQEVERCFAAYLQPQ